MITTRPWAPASTTPDSRRTSSCSGVRLTAASPSRTAFSSISASIASWTSSAASGSRWIVSMCASERETEWAISRKTVSIVPSAGSRTDS